MTNDSDIVASISSVVLYILAILYTVTFTICTLRVAPYLIQRSTEKNKKLQNMQQADEEARKEQNANMSNGEIAIPLIEESSGSSRKYNSLGPHQEGRNDGENGVVSVDLNTSVS